MELIKSTESINGNILRSHLGASIDAVGAHSFLDVRTSVSFWIGAATDRLRAMVQLVADEYVITVTTISDDFKVRVLAQDGGFYDDNVGAGLEWAVREAREALEVSA